MTASVGGAKVFTARSAVDDPAARIPAQERSGWSGFVPGLPGETGRKIRKESSPMRFQRDCTPLAVIIIVTAMISAGLILAYLRR